MRAIKIDPDMTTVDMVELDPNDLEREVGSVVGGPFTELPAADGHVILVGPDDGNHEVTGFVLGRIPSITGKAFLLGKEAGAYTDVRTTVEHVAERIIWIDSEVTF